MLADYTFYNTALARDIYSADQRYRAFVKEFNEVPAIFYFDYHDKLEGPVTFFDLDAGGAWEPAWSPTQEQIAFISDISQFEEIWIASRDGSGLRQLTETNVADTANESGKNSFVPEANGHPSWSPDGSKIVFWSNRTGNQQIWVMNADGSSPYLLSPSRYNDWNSDMDQVHSPGARTSVWYRRDIQCVRPKQSLTLTTQVHLVEPERSLFTFHDRNSIIVINQLTGCSECAF